MTKKDKLLVLIAWDNCGTAPSMRSLLQDGGLAKTGFASAASLRDAFYNLYKDGYLRKLDNCPVRGGVYVLTDKGAAYAEALIKAEQRKPQQMDLFESPAEKPVEKSLDEESHNALEDFAKTFDSVLSDLQQMRELYAVPSAGWVDITCCRMLRAKQKVADIIESALQLAG